MKDRFCKLEGCGKKFKPKTQAQKYCCTKHSNIADRKNKEAWIEKNIVKKPPVKKPSLITLKNGVEILENSILRKTMDGSDRIVGY